MMKYFSILFFMSVLASMTPAYAGFSLSTTRVVFPSNEHEYDLTVTAGNEDVVFQSWLEKDGDTTGDTPFSVLPSLARVHSNQAQIIRIIYQGTPMNKDVESLFWLNVQEIPRISSSMAEGKSSGISFTIRQRIKMFFRPSNVVTEPVAMTEKLKFNLSSNRKSLKIYNPSNNYITLVGFYYHDAKNTKKTILDASMIAPKSTKDVYFSSPAPVDEKIFFSSISDAGFSKLFSTILTLGKSVSPEKC